MYRKQAVITLIQALPGGKYSAKDGHGSHQKITFDTIHLSSQKGKRVLILSETSILTIPQIIDIRETFKELGFLPESRLANKDKKKKGR